MNRFTTERKLYCENFTHCDAGLYDMYGNVHVYTQQYAAIQNDEDRVKKMELFKLTCGDKDAVLDGSKTMICLELAKLIR